MHRKNGLHKAFCFKQFHIHHDRCAMKIGTDGVLLGAWANIGKAQTLLDIGTGTGIIALMLAQRSHKDALIDAIEIDRDAYLQAVENANASPWQDRINPIHTSLQNFDTRGKYDLIVSNPPYFINSHKPPDQKRTQSRHADGLPYAMLIDGIKKLMAPKGRSCLILPRAEAAIFMAMAGAAHLYCCKKTEVRSKPSKPVERVLLEFSHSYSAPDEYGLVLFDEKGKRTAPYHRLVSPFYLYD